MSTERDEDREPQLLPCPFCGSTNLHVSFHRLYGRVECQGCEAFLPLPEKSPEMQAAHWNRRSTATTSSGDGKGE